MRLANFDGWIQSDRTGGVRQIDLHLLLLVGIRRPSDNVCMALRHLIVIHPKAGFANIRLGDLSPTMKSPGARMLFGDVDAQFTYLGTAEPTNAEYRQFKLIVGLEQLGFNARARETTPLDRKARK